MKKILITGASGFIGQALSKHLSGNNLEITAAVRKSTPLLPKTLRQVQVGDILLDTDWTSAILDIDIVIHLAARVHVMNDTDTDPLAAFRNTNTEGTLNLARQAAVAGVRRFIFLSSIKVNGEQTTLGKTFKHDDCYIPNDPYGLSKYEAEQGLKEISKKTGMEIVIIRPPLVYGPGVKANFLSMLRWVNKGAPLPLGAIHNKRSLVALDNLVNLITTCINHPAAANQSFLVSDDNDLSTTELLECMEKALGKPSRLIPIPSSIIYLMATLVGKRSIAQRLCGSLQVDISHTKNTLNWKPPIGIDEALKKTARAYLNEKTN